MSETQIGRIAAIDYGTVRLGIALSDARRTIASPFENYTRRDAARDAERFRQLVRDEQVTQFVVGLPVHTNGRESQKSVESQNFGNWLHEATGVPVAYFDERFTTVEAEQLLAGAKLTKARRKARLDMLAAQILLTAYLESATKDLPPGALDA